MNQISRSRRFTRTGITCCPCNHEEISTWTPSGLLRTSRRAASLPSVLHRSPPKGSARQGLRRSPRVRGETLGWRSINPSMHRYRALDFESSSSSRRHPSRPRPRHPFPLSLSVRQTLFNLDAAASEHALGEHVHRAPPPVAQERCGVWTRGTRKKWDPSQEEPLPSPPTINSRIIEHFPSTLTRGPPLL